MVRELPPEKLYRHCDPDSLGFDTTDELSPLDDIIGQERAVKAFELGLGIRDHRYNIYVAGDPGTGRTSTVKGFLERVSADEPTPPDLCYVHNFDDPYHPLPLQLPAGDGCKLRDGMERLTRGLQKSIPAAYASDEFRARRQRVDEVAVGHRAQIFEALETEAGQRSFTLQRTPIGINAIPMHGDKPLTEEEFNKLNADQRQDLEQAQTEIQPLVQNALHEVATLEEQRNQQLQKLVQEVAAYLIKPEIIKLKTRFEGLANALDYLQAVEDDLIENVGQFSPMGENGGPDLAQNDDDSNQFPRFAEAQDPFIKYKVNVLVDNNRTHGTPVVVQENANYPNLFGKIEYRVVMGTLMSDFTLIRPGALHQANGGYLVLSADNLMQHPMSWEMLKVAIKSRQIALEDPSYLTGQTMAEGIKPTAIPLDVKVIIVGGHLLYDMIEAYDDGFRKFFNVKCEFADRIAWKSKFVKQFGPFLKARSEERRLLPFDKTGVARIVEYAGQLVGSQRKLSARFSDIMVIAREAVFWAHRDNDACVTCAHVEHALEERHYRSNLVEASIQEMIEDGTILVAVKGCTVGQVNGLTVYDLGNVSFGRPVRITANVYTGKDGVIDIESEAHLSGKIHTKGLLILKGWFGETFATDKPLSLSGSLTFEQSYGPVDGDSASCAELFVLLSALSEVPLRQGIAITGSMNQKGEVQPIGGVNEKIEGFYRVCKAKGLTGEQGVIIPDQNRQDLMLHREVVAAVREGVFHVWPIKTVEQGLSLLTGTPCGKRNARGKFSKVSVYGKVDARLRFFGQAFEPSSEEDVS